MRLFDVFRGTHWSLLGYAVDGRIAPSRKGLQVHVVGPAGALRGPGGHVAQADAMIPGDWVLIRPDGSIAAMARTQHLDALVAHFDRCSA